jgi:hypothetical protein
LNKDAILDVTVASSLVTDKKYPNDSEVGIISRENLHKKCKKDYQKTYSLYKVIFAIWASKTAYTFSCHHKKTQNNGACDSCGRLYLDDTKNKNGTELIRCAFCCVWCHTTCQIAADETHFMSNGCED